MDIKDLYKRFLKCSSVSIDTRTLLQDALFFAIKGDNFDGNRFAQAAIEKGAKYAVVTDETLVGDQFILVADSLLALQELGNYHRKKLDDTIFLSLTGSNGKTTTKELISHLLSEKYKVQHTSGNYNNHLGVPLTLLGIKSSTEIAVIEMGANHLLEIANLSKIAEPDYGLITNIGRAHIGEFGGKKNIIKAKTELYDFLKSHSRPIFFNDDNEILVKSLGGYENKLSYSQLCDRYRYNLLGLQPKISCSIDGVECTLDLGGEHNAENLRCAIAVASHFGLDPNQLRRGISSFRAPENRSQWINTRRNRVFLDAYNSNPDSMHAAVEYVLSTKDESIAIVLGEMLELGEYSVQEHTDLYELLESQGVDFYLIGESYMHIDSSKVFATLEEYTARENLDLWNGKTVLLKGSRGMKMERLLDYL